MSTFWGSSDFYNSLLKEDKRDTFEDDDNASELEILVHAYLRDVHYVTRRKTVFNVIYSNFNAGLVALPMAAHFAGVPLFAFAVTLVALSTGYTSCMVINMANEHEVRTLEDLSGKAFGRNGFIVVCFFELILSISMMCITMDVWADIFTAVLNSFGGVSDRVKHRYFGLCIGALLILPLCLAGRNMAKLGWSSVFSVMSVIGALACLIAALACDLDGGHSGITASNSVEEITAVKPMWWVLPLVVTFCFANNQKVFTAYSSMRRRSSARWTQVVFRSHAVLAILYILFGVLGYLSDVKTQRSFRNIDYFIEFDGSGKNRIYFDVLSGIVALSLLLTIPVDCLVAVTTFKRLYYKLMRKRVLFCTTNASKYLCSARWYQSCCQCLCPCICHKYIAADDADSHIASSDDILRTTSNPEEGRYRGNTWGSDQLLSKYTVDMADEVARRGENNSQETDEDEEEGHADQSRLMGNSRNEQGSWRSFLDRNIRGSPARKGNTSTSASDVDSERNTLAWGAGIAEPSESSSSVQHWKKQADEEVSSQTNSWGEHLEVSSSHSGINPMQSGKHSRNAHKIGAFRVSATDSGCNEILSRSNSETSRISGNSVSVDGSTVLKDKKPASRYTMNVSTIAEGLESQARGLHSKSNSRSSMTDLGDGTAICVTDDIDSDVGKSSSTSNNSIPNRKSLPEYNSQEIKKTDRMHGQNVVSDTPNLDALMAAAAFNHRTGDHGGSSNKSRRSRESKSSKSNSKSGSPRDADNEDDDDDDRDDEDNDDNDEDESEDDEDDIQFTFDSQKIDTNRIDPPAGVVRRHDDSPCQISEAGPVLLLWALTLCLCASYSDFGIVGIIMGPISTAILVYIVPSALYFRLGLATDFQVAPVCGLIPNRFYMQLIQFFGFIMLFGNFAAVLYAMVADRKIITL